MSWFRSLRHWLTAPPTGNSFHRRRKSNRRPYGRGAALGLESLETRSCLATLVSATMLTYQDKDGDNVSVVFSKPILNAANADAIFLFDSGAGAVNGSNAVKEQLQRIDLTAIPAAAGTSLTTVATPSAVNGGDGLAALGELRAWGLDLVSVVIDGDLGRIRTGDDDVSTSGLKALTAQSLGVYGTSTGAFDLFSGIKGKLDAMTIKSDIQDASISAGFAFNQGVAIGKITIGGSLIGGAWDYSGNIRGTGAIGPVTIQGNLVGGSADFTGLVESNTRITSITVGGSLLGGAGEHTGTINAMELGPVKIAGDLAGGAGSYSGHIRTYQGNLASVTIGGSLLGGAFPSTGMIWAEGDLGAVKIAHDVVGGAWFSTGVIKSAGNMAGVTIGGSLFGNSFDSGKIEAEGNLGPVKIAGDVVGGSGDRSGLIFSKNGTIAGVAVGGSLWGGGGEASGAIAAFGNLGPVTVKGDVAAGSHLFSGEIVTTIGDIGSVTIGGSLVGGAVGGGRIQSHHNLGAVKIGGNIVGAGDGSAKIINDNGGTIASVTVGGSILGGHGNDAGSIFSEGDIGAVKIGQDVAGGTGLRSGEIYAKDKLASVTIGGSLIGGAGDLSGRVGSVHDMGPVKIAGSIRGGDGIDSGQIHSYGKLTSATIGGDLAGGLGEQSGAIIADWQMGAVKIGHDLRGGEGVGSGRIAGNASFSSVTVGGSLVGGGGELSGQIRAAGNIESVSIGRDLVGGSASGNDSLAQSGFVAGQRIGKVTIGGSLIAGVDDTVSVFENNGAVRAEDDLGSVTIGGSVLGNATNPAIISARGQAVPTATADLAIGKLTVNGRVERAWILAGVDLFGNPRNADAQIGQVSVAGNWIASTIAAGAIPGADDFFGNGDDDKMAGAGVKDNAGLFSTIASLKIGGQAVGSQTPEHFGIVAEHVTSVKVGASQLPLQVGNSNDHLPVGLTANFKVREI